MTAYSLCHEMFMPCLCQCCVAGLPSADDQNVIVTERLHPILTWMKLAQFLSLTVFCSAVERSLFFSFAFSLECAAETSATSHTVLTCSSARPRLGGCKSGSIRRGWRGRGQREHLVTSRTTTSRCGESIPAHAGVLTKPPKQQAHLYPFLSTVL